jgi:mono/diheme cytochrome c family protein
MNNRAFSVLGLFDSAQQLMDAIPGVKAKVGGRLDAYTPYPVHGIEDALGLRKSPIAGMVLVMGLIGAISAIAFELWVGGVDYPLVTAGKPVFSWEAFVPIMFEVTVLFACFTAGLGMLLLLNRLPFFRHPMLRSKSMPLITRDKFALAVESDGQVLDVQAISAVLRDAGARTVELIEETVAPGPVSPRFLLRIPAVLGIACLAAGYLTYWGVKLFPVFPPMVHMLDQPRLDAQRESSFFKDGSGMRPPVTGTVARGQIPYNLVNQDEAAALANPLPRTDRTLRQGKKSFMTYCSVCHGVLGDGVPTLTAAYGAKPANLVAQKIRDYSDGSIYHVIMTGKNAMPSYHAEMTADERWTVVHYVRVLQRALNARDTDIAKETAK